MYHPPVVISLVRKSQTMADPTTSAQLPPNKARGPSTVNPFRSEERHGDSLIRKTENQGEPEHSLFASILIFMRCGHCLHESRTGTPTLN
jgi:hypothetical protein